MVLLYVPLVNGKVCCPQLIGKPPWADWEIIAIFTVKLAHIFAILESKLTHIIASNDKEVALFFAKNDRMAKPLAALTKKFSGGKLAGCATIFSCP